MQHPDRREFGFPHSAVRNTSLTRAHSARWLELVALFFLPCSLVHATTVAYYRFENGTAGTAATAAGSIVDSTGNAANSGTPSGNPTYSANVASSSIPQTGASNGLSLQFSGGQVVTFSYQFPLNTLANATLEFWLKPSTSSSEQDIFWTRTDSTDANRFNLGYTAAGNLFLDYRSATAVLHSITPPLPVSPGVWTHVAFVKAGNVWSAYANGVLQGSVTDSTPDLPTNTGWTLSGRGSLLYAGQIDEIRISDTALAPAQFLMQFPAAILSTVCSPSSPAPISGSTGAQGVLDPSNTTVTDPNQTNGLAWPTNAVAAFINMLTGQVLFSSSTTSFVQTGSATTLPGVSGVPAFPGGKLNFTSVHLPAGKAVFFLTDSLGLPPPLSMLSCQDVVLDSGSILGLGGVFYAQNFPHQLPGNFLGGHALNTVATVAAGFGPRTGSFPAAGSLYPPIGGGWGDGGTLSGIGGSAVQGGMGGEAIVIAAPQRITVNGDIHAFGSDAEDAPTGSSGTQGGGGGSVRLAGLLVEGVGTINTSAGHDSDGVIRSPAGPIEIQAFLQDLFSGSFVQNGTGAPAPIRGSAPVQPIPSNLPTVAITSINSTTVAAGTGSLTSPDVTLAVPSTAQVAVNVAISTSRIPDGTFLTIRAVGLDGSAPTDNRSVSQGAAVAHLTLNAGTTYQIVVTPSSAFLLQHNADVTLTARSSPQPAIGFPSLRNQQHAERMSQRAREREIAEQWMHAFGVNPENAGYSTDDSHEPLLGALR